MENITGNTKNYDDIQWNEKMSFNEFDVAFIKSMFIRQDCIKESFISDLLKTDNDVRGPSFYLN